MGNIRLFLICLLFPCCMAAAPLYAAEKWPGVDETVVNRIAREQGRAEKPSLLPPADGDLQLFLFLLAGAVGGFVAGYYWRVLLEGKNKCKDETPKNLEITVSSHKGTKNTKTS